MNEIKDNLLIRDRVSNHIREMIVNGACKAGDKILSERKMAQRFRVNHQTVRAALKQLAEEGLVETRKGSGTYVCDLPQVAGKRMVALLIRSEGHLFADLTQELSRKCQESGYLPVLLSIQEDRDNSNLLKRLNELKQMGCNHLITQNQKPNIDADLMCETIQRFPHLVWVWSGSPVTTDMPGHSVGVNDEEAITQSVSYLAELGHKRFAFLTHGIRQKNKADFKRSIYPQIWTFQNTLEKYNLPDNALEHIMMSKDDSETENAFRKVLSSKDYPTAILAANDYRAVKFIDVARSLNITLPDELSVIGKGNTPWARAYDMTTISFELSEIAEEALRLLQLPAGSNSHRIVIKPTLVKRNSTGPLKRKQH